MSSKTAPTEATQTHSDDPTTPPTTDVETDSTTADPLSLDLVFEVLKNERRRRVLKYLSESSSETVSLSDLAEHIAAIENDKPEKHSPRRNGNVSMSVSTSAISRRWTIRT